MGCSPTVCLWRVACGVALAKTTKQKRKNSLSKPIPHVAQHRLHARASQRAMNGDRGSHRTHTTPTLARGRERPLRPSDNTPTYLPTSPDMPLPTKTDARGTHSRKNSFCLAHGPALRPSFGHDVGPRCGASTLCLKRFRQRCGLHWAKAVRCLPSCIATATRNRNPNPNPRTVVAAKAPPLPA